MQGFFLARLFKFCRRTIHSPKFGTVSKAQGRASACRQCRYRPARNLFDGLEAVQSLNEAIKSNVPIDMLLVANYCSQNIVIYCTVLLHRRRGRGRRRRLIEQPQTALEARKKLQFDHAGLNFSSTSYFLSSYCNAAERTNVVVCDSSLLCRLLKIAVDISVPIIIFLFH
jgi:hypothetical protein